MQTKTESFKVRHDVPASIQPIRSVWPDNPERPHARPHWSFDEDLARAQRASHRQALADARFARLMDAALA